MSTFFDEPKTIKEYVSIVAEASLILLFDKYSISMDFVDMATVQVLQNVSPLLESDSLSGKPAMSDPLQVAIKVVEAGYVDYYLAPGKRDIDSVIHAMSEMLEVIISAEFKLSLIKQVLESIQHRDMET